MCFESCKKCTLLFEIFSFFADLLVVVLILRAEKSGFNSFQNLTRGRTLLIACERIRGKEKESNTSFSLHESSSSLNY